MALDLEKFLSGGRKAQEAVDAALAEHSKPSTADEIRSATARSELHPLVRDNLASPRGLCNAHTQGRASVLFCTLDYCHAEPEHVNGSTRWAQEWPPADAGASASRT
jgi:hypothetical protein